MTRLLSVFATLRVYGWVAEKYPKKLQCWAGNFDFETCCKKRAAGVLGHPDCWQNEFSFEECCLPEIAARLDEELEAIDKGDFYAASHTTFDLYVNYLQHQYNGELASLGLSAFEKARKSLSKQFDDYPHQLSWADVLLAGMGIECPLRQPDDTVGTSPYAEYDRCCVGGWFKPRSNCMQILDMFSNALTYRARQAAGGIDEYFKDFSEHWAFHHFTPSVLRSSDGGTDDSWVVIRQAHEIDEQIADALFAETEPPLGIVWVQHFPSYVSPKYCYGVEFFTIAFKTIFGSGDERRNVNIFEIGAGYGSYARLIASSRQRLAALPRKIDVHRYTILDVKSIVHLQKWYLNKTIGSLAQLKDWSNDDFNATLADHLPGSAFRIDLVEREQRDRYVHSYSQELAEFLESGTGPRPLRLLIAINSWHELPMSEFYWYYNTFVAGNERQLAADWILYVANNFWEDTATRKQLLLGPGPGQQFKVRVERCSETNCMYLLQRAS